MSYCFVPEADGHWGVKYVQITDSNRIVVCACGLLGSDT